MELPIIGNDTRSEREVIDDSDDKIAEGAAGQNLLLSRSLADVRVRWHSMDWRLIKRLLRGNLLA